MKLIFDQHLSPSLAKRFSIVFPGSTHVSLVGLGNSNDIDIWNFAKENDFIIVTKDSDYHDLGMRLGFPPYVLLIKRGNCATSTIVNIIELNLSNVESFITKDKAGILILF